MSAIADSYFTLASPSEGFYKEKGSKFFAFAFPVVSVAEVKERVEWLRQRFFDARHHCYAYRLGSTGEEFRAVDDGEPSGTGGRPIYGQLLSAGLTDVLIVVVRYFGGVLLGTSGLAAAYRAAARDAIAHGQVVERTVDVHFRLSFPYEAMNDVMRLLRDFGVKPNGEMSYEQQCLLCVDVRLSLADRFCAAIDRLRTISLTLAD